MCRYWQTNLICKRHKHRKIEWWQPAKKIVVHKNSRKNWFASIIIQIKKKGGGAREALPGYLQNCRGLYLNLPHTLYKICHTNQLQIQPPPEQFFFEILPFFSYYAPEQIYAHAEKGCIVGNVSFISKKEILLCL